VLSCLASEPVGPSEADVALIVSELVTNSVLHADADSSQLLRITVERLKDRLRIGVTDNGSEPCLTSGKRPTIRRAASGSESSIDYARAGASSTTAPEQPKSGARFRS
jgi:hypothetical protein